MTIKDIIESENQKISEEMVDGYLFSNIPHGIDWGRRIFMGGLDEENDNDEKTNNNEEKTSNCSNQERD